MPTYQYRCTECGEDLEAVQKFSDAPLTECPSCGGPLRKVFNAVGVVFKGTGFYRTDSRVGDSNGELSKADGKGKEGAAKTDGKESGVADKTTKSSDSSAAGSKSSERVGATAG
jgi:putative FmdB family regulatory protein